VTTFRRDFLKTGTIAIGTMTLAPWLLEVEAAQSAAVATSRNALADAALEKAFNFTSASDAV
jgi:hypothetical protein